MNILIFDEAKSDSDFWHYCSTSVKRQKQGTSEGLGGIFLTNLSQIDCMLSSSEDVTFLPYNFLSIPIADVLSKLDSNNSNHHSNNCYKYISLIVDDILRGLNVTSFEAGRTLSTIKAELLDAECVSVFKHVQSLLPMYQKNYFASSVSKENNDLANLSFTNIEISYWLKSFAIPTSNFVDMPIIDIPKLQLGNDINPFYQNENEYLVVIDIEESIDEHWLFYLGIKGVERVGVHSSIFKLMLRTGLANKIKVRLLSIATSRKLSPSDYGFISAENIAGWLKIELVNKVGCQAIFQGKGYVAFSLSSQIRAVTINKALELENIGVQISCIGPFEISIKFPKSDYQSVINRTNELLLYAE
jgi:hypothetical protein